MQGPRRAAELTQLNSRGRMTVAIQVAIAKRQVAQATHKHVKAVQTIALSP